MSELGNSDGTVGKALDVLDRVAAFGRPVRFSELLETAPFPKATLYRFVQVLTNQQMLAYDTDRQTYTPGVRLVRLAHSAWAQSSLGPIARPHLDALSGRLDETIHLAQLDSGMVLYLDKRRSVRGIDMFSQAGKVGPAYCTGIGKAMLAHQTEPRLSELIQLQRFHRFTPATITSPARLRAELEAIRAEGMAFDREEHEPGIICLAVPILARTGRAIGAISITSTTRRTTLDALRARAADLNEVAIRIARDAESWRFPETGPCMEGSST